MSDVKGSISVRRLDLKLTCDPSRTIVRFFWPGNLQRAKNIFERVMALNSDQVAELTRAIETEFGGRHPELKDIFHVHFQEAAQRINFSGNADKQLQELIGAYFTMEYSSESTALFNPSIVPARDQDGLKAGSIRFIMSLRAVGEGHISSIVFRKGVIDKDCQVYLDPAAQQVQRASIVEDRSFEKHIFKQKLIEMDVYDNEIQSILDKLGEKFLMQDLFDAIERIKSASEPTLRLQAADHNLIWLAKSNYEIRLKKGDDLTEMVLFPISEIESHGLEDMRLVCFMEDDGTAKYYGTYTAFDGQRILPQLMESSKPGVAHVHTLNGKFAQNKGMALFPRSVNGLYSMIARVDGENLFLLQSDNIRFWDKGIKIQQPKYPWEFMQIGNCGSPIETSDGWLLLTHGVGAMRKYCMGCILLDLKDPSRVIGRLKEPLLVPQADERSGYVPNVVYSCGGMLHNGSLVIPYGISDSATGFAVVSLEELLSHLK